MYAVNTMAVLLTCATLIKQLSQRSEISFSSFHYNVLYLIFIHMKYMKKDLIYVKMTKVIYGVLFHLLFSTV